MEVVKVLGSQLFQIVITLQKVTKIMKRFQLKNLLLLIIKKLQKGINFYNSVVNNLITVYFPNIKKVLRKLARFQEINTSELLRNFLKPQEQDSQQLIN